MFDITTQFNIVLHQYYTGTNETTGQFVFPIFYLLLSE